MRRYVRVACPTDDEGVTSSRLRYTANRHSPPHGSVSSEDDHHHHTAAKAAATTTVGAVVPDDCGLLSGSGAGKGSSAGAGVSLSMLGSAVSDKMSELCLGSSSTASESSESELPR